MAISSINTKLHTHLRSSISIPIANRQIASDSVNFSHVTMYISRVRATLALSEIERTTGGVEAETLAAQALLIEKMTTTLDPAMSWHFEQRNNLSHSIIRTRDE